MINKIAILGFRGVGKSSVSNQLRKITDLPLYSLDQIIEENAGMSIAEIVASRDWNYFRDLELEALRHHAALERGIVDCGGGILEGHNGEFSEDKFHIIKNNFFCVYLYLPDAKLLTRLAKLKTTSRRAQLPGEIQSILIKRKPWFEKIADMTLNTEKHSPAKIAQMIRDRIKDADA